MVDRGSVGDVPSHAWGLKKGITRVKKECLLELCVLIQTLECVAGGHFQAWHGMELIEIARSYRDSKMLRTLNNTVSIC